MDNLFPKPLTKESLPEELALRPRPKEGETPERLTETADLKKQLAVINSKLDMLKVQLDSLNRTMMVINEQLKIR